MNSVGTIHFDDVNMLDCYGRLRANNQGQLAKVLMTHELALRLPGIKFHCAHPGFVQTNIGQFIYSDYLWNSRLIVAFMRGLQRIFFKTAQEGAQTILHCAIDPMADGESGLYYE